MSTDASLLNKTYAINTPYDIYTTKYDLGNYNAGEQISITELYLQTYKNGSVNALPIKQYNQSFYVKFYCNGVLKKTITSSVSATLDEYDDYQVLLFEDVQLNAANEVIKNIKEQKLETFERNGFVAVEWGGILYN